MEQDEDGDSHLMAYYFAGFALDLDRGSLSRGGETHNLRPKNLEMLKLFLERPGRLITKDELLKSVWPTVIVTEDSLTRCISELRAALHDEQQTIIRTVPRRGYIFTPTVTTQNPGATASPVAAQHSPGGIHEGSTAVASRGFLAHPRWWAGGATAIGLILTAALWLQLSSRPATDEKPSIAVLPFNNLGSGYQHIAEGLSEDVGSGLAKFRELLVIADNSAAVYREKPIDIKQIGRELGVRYLVQGSVRSDGERIRITAQLIDAASGARIWNQHYDREKDAIFVIQDDVTRSIAGALIAHVSEAELQRAQSKPPTALAAYDYYLRGRAAIRHVYRQADRGETIASARTLFEKSLEADQRYAPAVQALAFTYALAYLEPAGFEPIGREYSQQDTIERALTLAQRAIELDANLAEAHATLGWVLHWLYRRPESIAAFERAFELNPSMSDGRFGLVLAHNGRAEEGISFLKRAMRLDPFHTPVYFTWLGNAYYLQSRYKEAFENLMTATSRLPGHRPTKVWLAAAAARIGEEGIAKNAVADVLKLQPSFTTAKWLALLQLSAPSDVENLREGMRRAGFSQ
jgi:adenylate cyclase